MLHELMQLWNNFISVLDIGEETCVSIQFLALCRYPDGEGTLSMEPAGQILDWHFRSLDY